MLHASLFGETFERLIVVTGWSVTGGWEELDLWKV